jgi:hypothetical protein
MSLRNEIDSLGAAILLFGAIDVAVVVLYLWRVGVYVGI